MSCACVMCTGSRKAFVSLQQWKSWQQIHLGNSSMIVCAIVLCDVIITGVWCVNGLVLMTQQTGQQHTQLQKTTAGLVRGAGGASNTPECRKPQRLVEQCCCGFTSAHQIACRKQDPERPGHGCIVSKIKRLALRTRRHTLCEHMVMHTPHQSELASKEGRLREEGRGHGAAGEAAAVHGGAARHGPRHICILHNDLHPQRRLTVGRDIGRTVSCGSRTDGFP